MDKREEQIAKQLKIFAEEVEKGYEEVHNKEAFLSKMYNVLELNVAINDYLVEFLKDKIKIDVKKEEINE